MKAIFLTIGMAFIGLLPNSSASQQTNKPLTIINREFVCFDTDRLMKELVQTHKETVLLYGKTDDQAGTTMSIWVNPSTRNWTIIATKENISCLIGSGTDLNLSPLLKGPVV